MTCLLSLAESYLWEAAWKRQLNEMFPIWRRDPDNLTMNHVCGEGDFSKPQEQAQLIPTLVLTDIRGAAEKTLFTMPQKSIVVPNYTTIRQGPQETFMDFVDRLQSAIEKQVENLTLREDMLKELAKANANESCKRIINALPFHPPPTLQQMIETCTRATNTEQHDTQMKRGGIPPPVTVLAPAQQQNKQDWMCSRCGKKGHTAKFCRAAAPVHQPTRMPKEDKYPVLQTSQQHQGN